MVVAAYVLGTVLAAPLGQHLALERGRSLGHGHVGGRDLPPFGLSVNPRVAQVQGFDGGGHLYPAGVKSLGPRMTREDIFISKIQANFS